MNREEAIGKINGEMQKSPDDRVLEAIGHYLIDRITDAALKKAEAEMQERIEREAGAISAKIAEGL